MAAAEKGAVEPLEEKWFGKYATSLLRDAPLALYDKVLFPSIFLSIWLITWQFALSTLRAIPSTPFPKILYPTPTEIIASFFSLQKIDQVTRPLYATISVHLPITMIEVAIGFAIGASLGVLAGSLIGVSKVLGRIIYPTAIILKSIPVIAIAPLLVVWFGYGIWSKVASTSIITFFPLVVGTATGIKSTDPVMLDLMKSLSASMRKTFFKVQLPGAMPYVFAGIKISITLAVVGAVVGELVAPGEGIGYLINRTMELGYADASFALFGVLAVVGLMLFTTVTLAEKHFVPWAETAKIKTEKAK
jgi:ABC-type nitrate/sulfonate/bicarbonate transport system permease component